MISSFSKFAFLWVNLRPLHHGSWHAVPKMTGRGGFVRDTIQTFLMEATKSAPKKTCPKLALELAKERHGSLIDKAAKKGDSVWGTD